MSAVFRNQVIAGHSIGASRLFGALLLLITLALVGVNAYHMGNFLDSKLTTLETGILWTFLLYAAGSGIAALEIPLGKSLVTSYRLNGLNFAVFTQGVLAVVIACMAVFAGMNSQLADADRRDTQTASYGVSASSFANMKEAAAITRDSAIARAQRIQDEGSRKIAVLDAKAAYQNKLVSIAQQEAANTLKKPVQMFESSSDEQYVTMMLFSVICSFGALFASMFHAVYINPLVAMPAFSLKAKANHDWDSDGSDFKSAKHELSPLANKVNGFLEREKVPARALPRQAENVDSNKHSSGDTENRPHVEDTRTGAVSNASNSAGERPPNSTTQKGATVAYSEGHYSVIKSKIAWGSIKPTQKPVKAELVKLKVRFVDDAARQQKAVEILEQLKTEGVILDNPDFGKGGQVVAKYILNPNYSENDEKRREQEAIDAKQGGDGIDWAEIIARLDRGEYVDPKECGGWDGKGRKPQGWLDYEQQLLTNAMNSSSIEKVNGGTIQRSGHIYSFMPDGFGVDEKMIRSVCPECSKQSSVSESNLEAWKGRVSCPDCSIDYVVRDNLVKKWKASPMVGAGVGITEDGISPVAGIGAMISK